MTRFAAILWAAAVLFVAAAGSASGIDAGALVVLTSGVAALGLARSRPGCEA